MYETTQYKIVLKSEFCLPASLLLRHVTKRLWRISDRNCQNFPKTRGTPIDTSHFPCISLSMSSPEKTRFLLKGNRTFPCVLACSGLFWPRGVTLYRWQDIEIYLKNKIVPFGGLHRNRSIGMPLHSQFVFPDDKHLSEITHAWVHHFYILFFVWKGCGSGCGGCVSFSRVHIKAQVNHKEICSQNATVPPFWTPHPHPFHTTV